MNTNGFRCDECAKTFDAVGKLNRHVKKHSKPYQCNKCARAFALRLDLDRHVRARHSIAVERHACSVNSCTFRATRKDNLRQHHRRLHPAIPFLQNIIAREKHKIQYCSVDMEITDSAPASVQQSKPEVAEHSPSWAYKLFFQAASAGDFTVLQAQLDFGLDINVRADDGSSALHCASRAGHASVVDYLLQRGADLRVINSKNRSPLHEALIGDELETVQLLIRKGATLDISSITIDILGQSGSLDILKSCLDHFADKVESTTLYNILQAASKFGQIRTVQAVLSLFVNDVSLLDDTLPQTRLSAWQKCSKRPDLDSKRATWELRAYTPLQNAAARGHLEIVQLLVNHGSDINQSGHHKAPFWCAVLRGHIHVAEYLFDRTNLGKDSTDLRLFYGGWTPLHQVAHDGRCSMIEFLLDRELFDIHVSDPRGRTPLHVAAHSGNLKAAMLLLERDNSNGTHNYTSEITPLHLAALGGHLEVVQALLNHEGFDAAPLVASELPRKAQFESVQVLEQLLKHPDFEDINATHETQIGYEEGLLTAMICKERYDCVQLLLSQGNINVNQKCVRYLENPTPLILAVELGQKDIVELLLQHKDIDINAQRTGPYGGDFRMRTALLAARSKGHRDIVELLLAHGARDLDSVLL